MVVFSATVSDPAALARASDFYSNLCRANVALSRARRRLVVVASRNMVSLMPSRAEQYGRMALWKQLRGRCRQLLAAGWQGERRVEAWAAAGCGGLALAEE